MHSAQRPSRWTVVLAFGLVYLFWGSTYLGIDLAVQNIPPALMCGLRFSVAGVVMLAVCAAFTKVSAVCSMRVALSATHATAVESPSQAGVYTINRATNTAGAITVNLTWSGAAAASRCSMAAPAP